GAGERVLVPFRRERADRLIEDYKRDFRKFIAPVMGLECLAREIEELVDALERGFFVTVIGSEMLRGDPSEQLDGELPRGLAIWIFRRPFHFEHARIDLDRRYAPAFEPVFPFHVCNVTRRLTRGEAQAFQPLEDKHS